MSNYVYQQPGTGNKDLMKFLEGCLKVWLKTLMMQTYKKLEQKTKKTFCDLF